MTPTPPNRANGRTPSSAHQFDRPTSGEDLTKRFGEDDLTLGKDALDRTRSELSPGAADLSEKLKSHLRSLAESEDLPLAVKTGLDSANEAFSQGASLVERALADRGIATAYEAGAQLMTGLLSAYRQVAIAARAHPVRAVLIGASALAFAAYAFRSETEGQQAKTA